MKIIKVIGSEQFKTWSKDNVEKVTYKGKTYFISRYIDYPKTNTLTLRKQAIVNRLIKDDMSINEISKITGVSESTIKSFLSMQVKQENYSNAQKYTSKSNNSSSKKVRVICYTDNSTIVYNSVMATAKAIDCSGSNVSNYCRSGKVYCHKSTKKKYRMSFVEE